MHDDRVGGLVRIGRPGERAALQPFLRVGGSRLVGGLGEAQALDADVEARHVHHREHLGHAAVRLADKRAFGGVEVHRSEERRVGKECGSTCRSRWSPYHSKQKTRYSVRKMKAKVRQKKTQKS